jgi:hypothetical protein
MNTDAVEQEDEIENENLEDSNNEIDVMVNHIIQGDNIEAQNIFGQLMSRKVSDALDINKYDISQRLFSKEE